MLKVIFCLLATCLLRPAFGQQAEDASPERQDRCFCVKFMGGFQHPYSLTKFRPVPARCRKMLYKPGPVSPFFEGLLTCEALLACRLGEEERAEKMKVLENNIAQAKKSLYGCCREGSSSPASCSPKCAAKWKKALKALEEEKREQENSVNEACIPKSRQK